MSQHVSHPPAEAPPVSAGPSPQPPDSSPGPRGDRIADRVLASSGAVFVVAILAGNSLTETVAAQGDGPVATAEEVSAGLSSGAVSAGLGLELVGLLCLVTFAASVAGLTQGRARIRALPFLTLAAAGLLVAVKLASAAPYVAARAAAEELPPEVLHALVETNGAAFVLCWLPMALLVGAVAASLHDAGLAGRAVLVSGLLLAVLGTAAAVKGALDPVDALPVPFLLSLLWIATISVRLAVRPRRR